MLKFRNINETSHHINLIRRTPDGREGYVVIYKDYEE